MTKRVILIVGTPCVGKTTTAMQLAEKLPDTMYLNLTDYAKNNGLTLGEDKKRKTTIIDEAKMHDKLSETINASSNGNIIIDGHYASAVTPTELVSKVFVLRRDPRELMQFMQRCGFSGVKLWENLSAEILDVCLTEAIRFQEGKICELDVTGKTLAEVVSEVLAVLDGNKKCFVGVVDWLGMLEREGLTDQYLKA